MNKLILISGKKGVGKDALASLYVKEGYRKIALADKIKEDLATLMWDNIIEIKTPVVLNDFYEKKDKIIETVIPLKDKNNMTIREWMQWYGQLMKKIFGDYYWTDILIHEMSKATPTDMVISDIRFPYEIERLYEKLENLYDMTLIRIERTTGLIDEDTSETALDLYNKDNYDYIIDNNKSLEDLAQEFKIINTRECSNGV